MLDRTFQDLFSFLKGADYSWTPLSPERLIRCRQEPEAFGALNRYFGLGLEVSEKELCDVGLPAGLLSALEKLRPAVSRCGNIFVPHAHWAAPPSSDGYVYLGQESFELLEQLQPYLESFIGRDLLDLGSGSGVLSFEVAPLVRRVLGIESSRAAVEWARAAAVAQGMTNVTFQNGKIGTVEAEGLVGTGHAWDIAIFNPPMALPCHGNDLPHRDGGLLGVELPLLFLDFAWRHLKSSGEVFCLATNPIVHGEGIFFDRLNQQQWKVLERKRLNPCFNQRLYRKERYSEQGIQRIELCFLRLRKR